MLKEIDNLEKYLRDAGIKPSIQRLKIFEYLVGSNSHPTVESIYSALSSQIPTLSKTTVYNTLKLFQQQGIVIIINIEDNETRFDADISYHGHFKCTVCKEVKDFPIPKHEQIEALDGHDISESHFYIKGICAKCKELNK